MAIHLWAVLLLGFSSGLPIGLCGSTLQAWMKTEGVDLGVIGLFALVSLPYSLKFLWSPMMDRYVPPFLGRRRGWLLVTQVAVAIAIAAMAFFNPRTEPAVIAAIALAVAFFSASQDIVVDAYRTDILADRERGPGSAMHTTGYRVAMLVSGAIALILSDHLPWKTVYLLMAATMLVGVGTTLLAPEPKMPPQVPKSLKDAMGLPLMEFFKRRGSLEVVAFSILYKLDAVMTIALMTPFMMELGFSRTDIGAVTKGFGLVATLIGTVVGGALIVRLGVKRGLWLFGFAQAFAGLSFLWLAYAGRSYPVMVTAISVENVCSAMGNTVFLAFLMSQCDRRYSATQFALLSSLFAVTRTFGGASSGYLVKAMGWPTYYILCTFAAVPAFLLLTRFDRWRSPEEAQA